MNRRSRRIRQRAQSSPFDGDLLIAPDGDGSVVLHVASGTYLRLDRSATEILELVQARGAEVAATIVARRHAIEHPVAVRHVESVIEAVRDARSTPQKKGRRPSVKGCIAVANEWARLPAKAKLVVLKVVAMTISVEVALRLMSVDTIARWAGAPLREPDDNEAWLPEVDPYQLGERDQLFLASMEWTLARWVYDGTCLRRALISGFALRRHHPELRIGLTDGEDLAHAWLKFDDFTLGALPTGTRVFSPLD